MAITEVGICNLALLRLGHDREISDLNEQSAEAGHCKTFYDHLRKTALRDHEWNFAVRRVNLASVNEEADEYLFAYKLPHNCLRALKIINPNVSVQDEDEDPIPYEIQGQRLYTDQEGARLKYIENVKDPNLFDPSFVNAFSFLLASELAGPLTQDNGKQKQMYELYLLNKASAAMVNKAERKKKASKSYLSARR